MLRTYYRGARKRAAAAAPPQAQAQAPQVMVFMSPPGGEIDPSGTLQGSFPVDTLVRTLGDQTINGDKTFTGAVDFTGTVILPGTVTIHVPPPNSAVITDATSALKSIPVSDGEMLIGSSTGPPAAALISGTNINVVPGSNSLSISVPQSVAPAASPSFASMALTNAADQLTLGTTNPITVNAGGQTAPLSVSMPVAGAPSTNFVLSDGVQTLNGAYTFTNPIGIPGFSSPSPSFAITAAGVSVTFVTGTASTAGGSSAPIIVVPTSGDTYSMMYNITSSDSTDTMSGGTYEGSVQVKNVGGVVSFFATKQIITTDPALSGSFVSFSSSGINFQIIVTGAAGANMNWTGYVEFVAQTILRQSVDKPGSAATLRIPPPTPDKLKRAIPEVATTVVKRKIITGTRMPMPTAAPSVIPDRGLPGPSIVANRMPRRMQALPFAVKRGRTNRSTPI